MSILVTGAAGFVGSAVARRLLDRGEHVIGIDNFNDYYDPALKEARVAALAGEPQFRMVRGDIADAALVAGLVREARIVVHLAAQAGVRYSLVNPFAYERSNLAGHLAVLEACRNAPALEQLVYASSSSVYGDKPLDAASFREEDAAIAEPVSLYAATKRANELMSAAYAKLYGFPQTGLRFFTVYGPWGRPDMAYFSFTRKILAGETIEVFGEGKLARDFTYIDDIVDGIMGVIAHPPARGDHAIYNIGNSRPESVMALIAAIEAALGRGATKVMLPMQPGDVTATFADVSKLAALCGYAPKVRLEDGIARFVDWYRGFYPA